MFSVFLGGLSLHLSQVILCHFFEIDMVWGATSKEAGNVVFGKETGRIFKRFKGTFLVCMVGVAIMVLGFWGVPYTWEIRHFPSIFPFTTLVTCHFLLPVVLNPTLMILSW